MDDETLKMYVEESLEHLSGIENDFLSIEESGANIDEELVNKVFRAAHSIKGGAGFIGLTVVKELAHKMENVLGMIRGKEIVPDKNIINTLLNASDILKGLLENAEASNDAEIDEHLNALQRITENSGKLEEERDVLADTIDILVDDNIIFSIPEPDIDRAKKRGKHIYFIELDLINDLPQERRDVSAVIKELENIGIILDCKIDFNMSGKLEDEFFPVELPFFIVFSSIADPDVINSLFNFSEKKIFSISDDIIIRDGKGLKVFIRDLKESENHIESKEIKIIENEISSDIKESSSEVKEKSVEKEKKKADKRNKVNGTGSTKKETSLRVSVEILDSLMNLAGELVLSRNQLLQAVNSFEQREIEIAGQRVNMITSDLQEAIMFTRMQPIGNV
ncbi:MAG: Hpt domain-containing protein, partial [Thermodesulfobacteriota bacterium]|nr:Hpt domain-containing protein [Thermodesulfobacteriota bacterium]